MGQIKNIKLHIVTDIKKSINITMASRSGPRAEGTDGSDYKHRETVADHYTKSAELKTSVKKCLIPHLVLFAGLVFKTMSLVLKIEYFTPLAHWEMTWALSGVFAMIGLRSLPKNDVNKLLAYILGNLFFGVGSLLWGSYELVQKLLVDFEDINKPPKDWKNSPTKMAVVAVCLSWQVTGV